MKILTYKDLDTKRVTKQYNKVVDLLKADNFASAEVKKLKPSGYYRAKLDDTNRLLFQIVKYQDDVYALILEVIHQHAYDKSVFLRGAVVDESKILTTVTECTPEPISYINNNTSEFHFLDKVLSFADCQEAIYQHPLPLMIIGSAGSGKTALTLEKIKVCTGDILYVTHSAYLTQKSRNTYYHCYNNEKQQVDFLSYRELLETLRIPPGKEIDFSTFKAWLNQARASSALRDPNKLFEEFNGVISGNNPDAPYLSEQQYLKLGIKQSIFCAEARQAVYQLFKRYLAYLDKHSLYDINLLSFEYLKATTPKYDYIIVDEVQDFTPVQLRLILRNLRKPMNFLLCGDANQIVHPNFFSWAKIKTLFYQGELVDANRMTRLLNHNYRNAKNITTLSNQLLKIKSARLGSVDKESSYLVESVSPLAGQVMLMNRDDKHTQELNRKSSQSTHFAIIVLRDDMKQVAKQYFDSPLVFSVHEAKGLEYENIILFDFLSCEEKAYRELCDGIDSSSLSDQLTYSRAKDKSDRSLEIYKFYINALYVAVTRAIRNVYWVESNNKQAILKLLPITFAGEVIDIDAKQSSLEEWQLEAQKLAQQGKMEQADTIREHITKERPTAWQVMDNERIATVCSAIENNLATKQDKIDLLEYAIACHDEDILQLLQRIDFKAAKNLKKCQALVRQKHFDLFKSQRLDHAHRLIKAHGLQVRNPFNQTLLMVAAYVGNVTLAEDLMQRGIDVTLTDNLGKTALCIAFDRALRDSAYARNCLAPLYDKLAPSSFDVKIDNHLIKLDRSTMEYTLLLIAITLLPLYKEQGLNAPTIREYIMALSENVIAGYRKKRAYISSILSKNEMHSSNPYSRKLLFRLRTGYYFINPDLELKQAGQWINLCMALRIVNAEGLQALQQEAMKRAALMEAELASSQEPLEYASDVC